MHVAIPLSAEAPQPSAVTSNRSHTSQRLLRFEASQSFCCRLASVAPVIRIFRAHAAHSFSQNLPDYSDVVTARKLRVSKRHPCGTMRLKLGSECTPQITLLASSRNSHIHPCGLSLPPFPLFHASRSRNFPAASHVPHIHRVISLATAHPQTESFGMRLPLLILRPPSAAQSGLLARHRLAMIAQRKGVTAVHRPAPAISSPAPTHVDLGHQRFLPRHSQARRSATSSASVLTFYLEIGSAWLSRTRRRQSPGALDWSRHSYSAWHLRQAFLRLSTSEPSVPPHGTDR